MITAKWSVKNIVDWELFDHYRKFRILSWEYQDWITILLDSTANNHLLEIICPVEIWTIKRGSAT